MSKGLSSVVDPSITEDDEDFLLIIDEKTRKKRENLLNRVLSGSNASLIERVAHILNHYPKARDSDVALSIKFVEVFHPECVDLDGKFRLTDLYNIPKFYDMQRYRAKIQNEYKLFLSSPDVRRFRKEKQTERADEFIRSLGDTDPVTIFIDESGKGEDLLIVGGLWIYRMDNYFRIINSFKDWRNLSNIHSEMHFSSITGNNGIDNFRSFFENLIFNGEYCSLIALVIKNKGLDNETKRYNLQEAYKEIVISGIQSEINHKRVNNICNISITKDITDENNEVMLLEMKRKIRRDLSEMFNKQVIVDRINSVNSKENDLIQVVDLFTGILNRWINHGMPSSSGNRKEKLSYEIGNLLGLSFDSNGKLKSIPDFCKILYLDDLL